MNNHEFIDRLLQKPPNPRWIIVLCNILDGLDSKPKLYDDNFVREAVTWWREDFLLRLKAMKPKENEDDLLETSLTILGTPGAPSGIKPSSPKPDLRLKCRTSAPTTSSYTNAMLAATFVLRVLHPDDQADLGGDGELGAGPKYFMGYAVSQKVRIQPGEGIGKPGGIVFLAAFRDVAPLLTGATKANDVRDHLGLVHWEKNKAYVMLELNAGELTSLRQGRPTFVDAGSHRRFMAVASDPANQTKVDWGFTLDLDGFANTRTAVDGLPERVCERIEASNVSSIKLHPLGLVTAANRGMTPADDDEKYAKWLLERSKRSLADIETRMKEIV